MSYYVRITIFLVLAIVLEILQLQAGFVIALPIATWLIISAVKSNLDLATYQLGLITALSIVWGIFFATNWGLLIFWYLFLIATSIAVNRFMRNELASIVTVLLVGLVSYIIIFNLEFGLVATPLQLVISIALALFLRNFLDDSMLHNYSRKYKV